MKIYCLEAKEEKKTEYAEVKVDYFIRVSLFSREESTKANWKWTSKQVKNEIGAANVPSSHLHVYT